MTRPLAPAVHDQVDHPARAFAASARTTGRLLRQGRLRLPREHVGRPLRFADGTTSYVYRETVLLAPVADPAVLVVRFRLLLVDHHRPLHALFRWESLANTPLFAGFPGFRTKLWCTDLLTGVYRGVYDWDGADQADDYARTLATLLRKVSEPGSVQHHVAPGQRREPFLGGTLGDGGPEPGAWWRPWPAASP